MKTSEVLEKAAEYIDKYGWIKGTSGPAGGPNCAMGAIYAVEDEYSGLIFNPIYAKYFADVVANMWGVDNVIVFNDRRAIVVDDVIELLLLSAFLAKECGE